MAKLRSPVIIMAESPFSRLYLARPHLARHIPLFLMRLLIHHRQGRRRWPLSLNGRPLPHRQRRRRRPLPQAPSPGATATTSPSSGGFFLNTDGGCVASYELGRWGRIEYAGVLSFLPRTIDPNKIPIGIDPERAFCLDVRATTYTAKLDDGSETNIHRQDLEWVVDTVEYRFESFIQDLGERIIWGSSQEPEIWCFDRNCGETIHDVDHIRAR